jgi:tetratricopeptide (TPR) repeat protein
MKLKIIALLMFLLPFALNGQTINDAKDAYNKGAKVFATDKDSALIYFEQSFGICKTLGTPADSLRMKIEAFIPSLYYDLANASYKEKKFEEALAKGQKAMQIAESYKDEKNKQRVTKLITSTNIAIGVNYYKNNDLDNAIKYWEVAVKLDPKLEKVWYNIAQAYLKKGDAEKMGAAMDKTFELAKAENDTATIKNANKQCRDFYYKQGLNAGSKNENTAALTSLNKALSYDIKFVDSYYVMATIYNKLSKSKEALDAINNALKYETVPANIPRLYFQMGYAYAALKQNAEACSAFKKVVDSKDKDLAPKANDIIKKNLNNCAAAN